MMRIATAMVAVVALLAVAGCGGGDTKTVEGQTVAGASTAPITAATTPALPKKLNAKAQLAKLQPCVGGTAATTYKWFKPTVQYAESMGGGGFTTTLGGKPVTLMVFPYLQAAQYGYKDVQNRLILLQQRRPTDYATVSALATQTVGNVLEMATQGPLDPASEATVQGCISSSTA